MLSYKDYIKIEMHAHTFPLSECSRLSPKELVLLLKKANYDAVLLTNHYKLEHLIKYGKDKESQNENFYNEYLQTKLEGEKVGLKVFFGAEVLCPFYIEENGEKIEKKCEFLLVGIDKKFLDDYFPIYNMNHKEFYEICKQNNVLSYQTHPYRAIHGCYPTKAEYVDGYEVYNPHKLPTEFNKSLNLTKKGGILRICGSDVHYVSDVGTTAMFIPKNINNQFELRDYLKSGESIIADSVGIIDIREKI